MGWSREEQRESVYTDPKTNLHDPVTQNLQCAGSHWLPTGTLVTQAESRARGVRTRMVAKDMVWTDGARHRAGGH